MNINSHTPTSPRRATLLTWVRRAMVLCGVAALAGLSILGVGIGVPLVSMAQGEPHHGPERKELEQQQRKIIDRIRVMRALKLTEVLELDEATGAKLFKVLADHDEKVFAHQRTLKRSERTLKRALRNDENNKVLEGYIEAVIKNKRALDDVRVDQIEAASKVLPPKKRARFLFFMPKFEREVRKVLKDFRKQNRGAHPRKGRKGKHKKKHRQLQRSLQ